MALFKTSSAVFFMLLMTAWVSTASAGPIEDAIHKVEEQYGARVGAAVLDTSDGALWHYNGNQRFPFMSTFKTLACAKLLKDVEDKKRTLEQEVTFREDDLVFWSPITEKMVGKPFSLEQACTATMTMSDNTAGNIVLNQIDGPGGLTDFLRQQLGDAVSRLDRMEPDLNEAKPNDPRDTTSPVAMVHNLNKLLQGDVLSPAHVEKLTQWMKNNRVANKLLRSILPENWSIADRSGAGKHGSRAVTAAVWNDDHKPIMIAIYLTQTEASYKERNSAIVAIGRAIFNVYK